MGRLTRVANLPRRVAGRAAVAAQERALRKRTLSDVRPVFTPLPGQPFGVAVANDGLHAFVSLPSRNGSAIAVLRAAEDQWTLVRTFPLPDAILPRGLVVDRSGGYILVAGGSALLALDREALVDGSKEIVASSLRTSGNSVQVALTPDDRTAFVTEEDNASVLVVDLGDLHGGATPSPHVVGHLRLPPAPVGCAVSGDGRHAFVTSQMNDDGSPHGVLTVIDVETARGDPQRAMIGRTAAGDRPVRVALAAETGTVWVSARGSNTVLGFDAAGLLAAPDEARPVEVAVGPAPVGLTAARGGALLVVANSNRFRGGGRPQTLSVIDTPAALAGRNALIGTIPAGAFPRELVTLPDDETILATNFTSGTLETVSLANVGIGRKAASGHTFPASR